jgi:hypothetical protein
MTITYAPTINPGDTRRRTRFIGIRTPLSGVPSVEVLEQDVVRLTDGERVLADLGHLPVQAFDPAQTFELRDPETDALLGSQATVGQTMALIYSWVRDQQTKRDAAQGAP